MKVLAFAAAAMAAFLSCSPAHAETTLCTEITALPFTITVQGVYCLKQNLNVNLTAFGSAAITINAGNVTIDFNGFRVNNQAPLATNEANGVLAQDRKNITLRNGFIRGFNIGVHLKETTTNASSAHMVEGMKVADCNFIGILLEGDKSVVRDNRVLDIVGVLTGSSGIVLENSDDSVVSGNFVAGMLATGSSKGISLAFSDRVEVSSNTIRNVNGSTGGSGIKVQFVDQAMLTGNRLLNDPGTGTNGIVDGGSSNNILCYSNEVGGFGGTPFSGCNDSGGNHIGFN